jgi:hypothetical protein
MDENIIKATWFDLLSSKIAETAQLAIQLNEAREELAKTRLELTALKAVAKPQGEPG